MEPLITHTGRVAPLDRSNVDTDAIIPKQYLKSIKRTGFGAVLVDEWRFKDAGTLDSRPEDRTENPAFVLNQPDQRGASILLARRNFGCGSSREHAVWALADYGFRVVIAESYADIFFSNCFKNGVLPLVLEADAVEVLMQDAQAAPLDLTVDLQACEVRHPDGRVWGFEIDGFRRDALMQGLDEIGKTLQYADAIRAFESRQRAAAPWLYAGESA